MDIKRLIVEVTTSSDDLSYFLLVWNVVTILQHFLFCKWQGIQECLHRRFPIAILPAVWTWFIVFPQPSSKIVLQHLNGFVDLFSKSNLIEFRENRFMESLADSIRLRRFCFLFLYDLCSPGRDKAHIHDVPCCHNIPIRDLSKHARQESLCCQRRE